VKNLTKAVTVTLIAGGLAVAGAGAATATTGGAGAYGHTSHSPGVLSGNLVQVPIQVPVNACGNTVSVIGLLNPTFGNTCINSSGHSKH
jgi:hypothetical protein